MRIINLTPHTLHIRRVDGSDIVVEPSGIVPRLAVSRTKCAAVVCEDSIEIAVSRTSFGALTEMPVPTTHCTQCLTDSARRDWHGGTLTDLVCPYCGERIRKDHRVIFVVSALCAQSPELAGRTDVFSPGEAIRDESGKIIGAQGLSYITPITGARK